MEDAVKHSEFKKFCDDIAALLKEKYSFHAAFYSLVREFGLSADEERKLRTQVGQELGSRKKRRPAPSMKPAFDFSSKYENGDLIVTDARTSFVFTFVNRKRGPALVSLANHAGINPDATQAHRDAAFAYAYDEFERMRIEQTVVPAKSTETRFSVHICGIQEVIFSCVHGEIRFTVRALTDKPDAGEVDGILFGRAYKMAVKHFNLEGLEALLHMNP